MPIYFDVFEHFVGILIAGVSFLHFSTVSIPVLDRLHPLRHVQ